MTNNEEVLKWNHSWAHNLHHTFFTWVSVSIRMPKVSESIYLLDKIQVWIAYQYKYKYSLTKL